MNQNGIRAVIFDLGNVLVQCHEERVVERVASRTGKSLDEIRSYVAGTPYARQLALGQLSNGQFFKTVAGDLGFDGGYDEFALIWSEMFTPMEGTIALAAALAGAWPRYILSNTNAIHVDYISRQFAFFREFEGYVLSHEVGLLKPDAAIYELTAQKFGLQPAEAVFVDDLAENVAGARATGMRAIHFQNAEQVRQELTKLGITPI